MTKLSKSQLADLIKLADSRVKEAFDLVEQLVDDPKQAHMMRMAVIARQVGLAAEFLSEHCSDQSGKRQTAAVAYFRILTTLASCGDEDAMHQYAKECADDRS